MNPDRKRENAPDLRSPRRIVPDEAPAFPEGSGLAVASLGSYPVGMRAIRNILFSLTLAAFAPHTTASPLEGRRPNIIFIITDDQGYGDMSCHGNPVLRTPRIDRLHRQSVRFEDFQVSPTCLPTRAALMTGRHEFRSGVSHTIFERERLDLRSVTIASTLKDAGYTTGIFGKWHLGDEDPYQPDKRGFDEVFIHGGGGIDQTFPGSCGDAPETPISIRPSNTTGASSKPADTAPMSFSGRRWNGSAHARIPRRFSRGSPPTRPTSHYRCRRSMKGNTAERSVPTRPGSSA